jgi:hypothetical protein
LNVFVGQFVLRINNLMHIGFHVLHNHVDIIEIRGLRRVDQIVQPYNLMMKENNNKKRKLTVETLGKTAKDKSA